MADDVTLEVGIQADATDAVRDMKAAATAASALADSFREIAGVATSAAKALSRAEQGVTGTARGSKAAAQAVQATGQAFKTQAAAASQLAKAQTEVYKTLGYVADAQGRIRNAKGHFVSKADLADAQKLVNIRKAQLEYEVAINNQRPGLRNAVAAGSKGGPAVVPVNHQAELESIRATTIARQQATRIIEAQRNALLTVVQANIAESRAAREAGTANRENARVYENLAQQRERAARAAQRYATIPSAAGRQIPNGLSVPGQQIGSSFGVIEAGAANAGRAVNGMSDSLFTARFALNDISMATGIAGAALLAFNTATVKAAATYETAMAAIQRTTGATASQMAMIQDQFVELAQTVPAGFDNLAKIGELAGQLNIPTERLASFTETVAQFTSSTDVAVQGAAEAFGRLDALLPDVQGNYEALGSSILNVGVNSVATESAIISTTTQIAAAGAQARFSADEVIGLAASFASLGIAPEAARGSTIRIFSEIRQAASAGGAGLEEFARIAGMSAQEFQSAWNTGDTSDLFMEFLKGLQTEGTNAETALRNLGITGVRDINALLRLSQNVDIVAQSFGYANSGFDEATQLATAFGITSETLNSRLDILGQSFQALFAELGASGTGPIKDFVNVLIDMIKAFTDLARNPVVQWIAVFGGLFTLLAGGTLILTSLVARLGALRVAMLTTREELLRMQTGFTGAAAAAGSFQNRLVGAGIALTRFRTLLNGLLMGTAITAGLTLIVAGIQAVGEASKSAGDKAEEAFGDLAGLTSALTDDTKVFRETGDAIGFVEGKLTTVTDYSDKWVVAVESATGAQTSLATEAERTAEAVSDQTFAIGENTAAWLAQKLANDQTITDMIKRNEVLKELKAPTLDVDGFIAAGVRNDTARALEIIEDYEKRVAEWRENNGATSVADIEAIRQVDALKESLELTSGALGQAAAQGRVLSVVNDAVGVSAEDAANGVGAMGDEGAEASGQLDALKNAVDGLFGGMNSIIGWGSAISDLFGGLAASGVTSFSILGAVGEENMGNLQNAILTTIIAGEAMGVSAVDSVGALFLQLQRAGIDTANLLSSLASIPGIGEGGVADIEKLLAGTRSLTGNADALQVTLAGVADASAAAANAVAGSRGGGGGSSPSLAEATKEAAKEIRTLVDYASDLEGVFSRAFDIRFGAQSAIDQITSGWLDIAEAADDARERIREANAEIAGLKTDNKTLAYFLRVAKNYGDNIRAAEIAQEIADNNAKMAEEQKNAADATAELDKNLEGNSQSAIDNRTEITGLVSEYQDLLAEYASSGMSQADLQKKAKELKNEFTRQATQAGYSKAQIEKYTESFDDMAIAINGVPRNITVKANTNPARQALQELVAKAKQVKTDANKALSGIGSGVGVGGIGAALANSIKAVKWPDLGKAAGDLFAQRFKLQLDQVLKDANVRIQPGGGALRFDAKGNLIEGNLGDLRFFKSGGYTGGGGVNDAAGVVHGKEYVINAENTSRLGLGFLNALNSGLTPSAVPNGTMMVELSPRDRALLASAGNVSLSIDGKVIASAANSANFVAARRGSN